MEKCHHHGARDECGRVDDRGDHRVDVNGDGSTRCERVGLVSIGSVPLYDDGGVGDIAACVGGVVVVAWRSLIRT